MRSNIFNVVVFLIVAAGLVFLWYYAEKHWLPKPQDAAEQRRKQEEERLIKEGEEISRAAKEEADKQMAGAAAAGWAGSWFPPQRPKEQDPRLAKAAVAGWLAAAAPVASPKSVEAAQKPAEATPQEPPKPSPLPTLIALGGENYNLRVLLTTRGGAVQQVVLPRFAAADRLGREVKERDGKPVPLYLIPGESLYYTKGLEAEYFPSTLKPGRISDPAALERLSEPSYALYHYASLTDRTPDPYLGETEWHVVSDEHPEEGEHKVVFEATLGDPYQVKFRKTFTLSRGDYHIGFQLDIERLPGGRKGVGQFRYQLAGPHGLPIEGEWYTPTYRDALIGWVDRKNTPQRQIEDAGSIASMRGGDEVTRGENTFKYAMVETQFFAAGMAVDDAAEGAARNPWEHVRATTEAPLNKRVDPNTRVFQDITVRAASVDINLEPGKTLTHKYLLYHGPAKVRLLGLMTGDRAVDPALVERYSDKLDLRTIKDFHSPTWIGSFANFIWWSDIVIAVTNLMHWFLAAIHGVVQSWGVSIIVVTLMVRLLLLHFSRKQTRMNLKMMEMQKRLAPQIEELKRRYADDFNAFNREKMRLMMANGMNPAAQMGGCLLILLQTPVMMGLYFCLQESIFFRLDQFLWIRNLAAPDMTLWWSEKIPFLSSPENIGSFYYLGPYLNVLPLVAVGLMLWQQKKMMPVPTDDQMRQQQQMMKFTMMFMALMFYKVASGLALYFIIGSIWGLIERRYFVKHPGKDLEAAAGGTPSAAEPGGPLVPKGPGPVNGQPDGDKPKTFLGRMREAVEQRMEELKKQADEQSKRQIRNEPDRRDRDRKKKRRR